MRLKVKLNDVELDNPIIPASGTFGYGYEFNEFYDINILPTFSTKGTTLNKRFGNNTPRIAECNEGMLNAIGLQNPGLDNVLNDELVKLKKVYNKKVILNISGSTIEDYVEIIKRSQDHEMIQAIELNVSCPNVKEGGIAFGTNRNVVFDLVTACKKISKLPIYVKLSPNVTDIVDIAKACEEANADGISMINTLIGMRINLQSKKPILANKMGGFSGKAILPVSLRMIYQVYQAVKIPIIGIGGVSSARDVIEMMLAGASAVQVGSENLINPKACYNIIKELPKVMDELGIKNIKDIIGGAHE